MRTVVRLTAAIVLGLASPLLAQTKSATDQQLAGLHYVSGWEKLKAEAYDDAAAEFSTAIRLDPRMALAHYGLGRAEMGRKHFADAARDYEACRDLYVARAGQKFSSQFEATRMRQDQALELQQAITTLGKGSQNAQTQLLNRHLQAQLMRVQQSTDRGLNMTIDDAIPSFVSLALGSAYFRANRLADAEHQYQAAIAADTNSGEAYSNLAVVYLMTNRPADAETAVKAAEKVGYRVNPHLKEDIQKKLTDRR